MSPGHDGAPTPANAGATNRQNLNSANATRLGPPCGCPRRGEPLSAVVTWECRPCALTWRADVLVVEELRWDQAEEVAP